MFSEGRREEVDELMLVTSVIQELCSWGPVNHIWSNLETTAGVLGTLDVVVIFWWSAVSSGPDNAHSSGNCLRSPARSAVVPTSPCREAIHHQSPGLVRLCGSVNAFRLVFEKSALFALFIFWSLLLNRDNGKRVSSYCKLVSTVISRWAKMITLSQDESSSRWP